MIWKFITNQFESIWLCWFIFITIRKKMPFYLAFYPGIYSTRPFKKRFNSITANYTFKNIYLVIFFCLQANKPSYVHLFCFRLQLKNTQKTKRKTITIQFSLVNFCPLGVHFSRFVNFALFSLHILFFGTSPQYPGDFQC